MKTIYLKTSILMMFVASSINAKTLITIHDIKGQPPPHNSGIPIVESDGDDVTIKSDSTIYNVDIVIRDQFGNIMHHSTQDIGPMETTISVPDADGFSEKATIDIYYDRRHLSGNFDE